MLWSGTIEYVESRRWAISSELISSEKKHTQAPCWAICTARLRANDVLPTPGRAPTTIIWPARRPRNILSMAGKPVMTPAAPIPSWLIRASSS